MMFPSPNLGLSLKLEKMAVNKVIYGFPSPYLGLSLKLC